MSVTAVQPPPLWYGLAVSEMAAQQPPGHSGASHSNVATVMNSLRLPQRQRAVVFPISRVCPAPRVKLTT